MLKSALRPWIHYGYGDRLPSESLRIRYGGDNLMLTPFIDSWAFDLNAAIEELAAGGPGSGCNPEVGKCGRPSGSGLERQWSEVDRMLEEYKQKELSERARYRKQYPVGYKNAGFDNWEDLDKDYDKHLARDLASFKKQWAPEKINWKTWDVTEVSGEWHPAGGEKGWILLSAQVNDGKPAGEILLSPEPKGKWAARLLMVPPKFQRQGVATKLMQEAIDWLKKKGVKEFIADPEGGTTDEAAGVWRKFGATETGTKKPGSTRFHLKLSAAADIDVEAAIAEIEAGGPGSGCNPEAAEANGGRCGRPDAEGDEGSDEFDDYEFWGEAQTALDELPKSVTPEGWDPTEEDKKVFTFIEKGKRADNNFRKLADAIGYWSGHGHAFVTELSEAINKGDKATIAEQNQLKAMKYTAEQAEIMNRAVAASRPREVEAWRGLTSMTPIKELEGAKNGSDVQIVGVRSFSHSADVARDFALPTSVAYPHRYILKLVGKAKGINAAALSLRPEEEEFITNGRFKVVSTTKYPAIDGGKTRPAYTEIQIKQIGVIAPPKERMFGE